MQLKCLNVSRMRDFAELARVAPRRIYICGSSGAGKSTLWRHMRNLGLRGVVFPTRFISRPPRPDDMPDENLHLDLGEFPNRLRDGRLDFYWPKHLPLRDELYGFAPNDADLTVYGCNNEFILNSPEMISRTDILRNSIIVLVSAASDRRLEHLSVRHESHAITPAEMEYRLNTDRHDDGVREHSDIEVHNDYSDMRPLVTQLVGELLLDQEGQNGTSR